MPPLSKNMDFLTKHWKPFPRRCPAQFPLANSNHIPEKRDWVRSCFASCNFSIILRGTGLFRRMGNEYPVAAPCVITQWPGEDVEYGPHDSWEEWFFVYHRRDFARFRERGFVDLSRPVWPVADPASVRLHLAEFGSLTRVAEPRLAVDRIDRIAERAILDTLLQIEDPLREDGPLRSLVAAIRADPAAAPDFSRAARDLGCSTTTFRRRWMAAVGSPPATYLLAMRIAEACRLLVETTLSIREVAARTGFQDEFYFSRRFRLEFGQCPRDYRRTFVLKR